MDGLRIGSLKLLAKASMKVCRFAVGNETARIGLVTGPGNKRCVDLTPLGVDSLETLLERPDLESFVHAAEAKGEPGRPLTEVRLLAPVEAQEVWAAGVTYLRSKAARMEESEFSANAYDRVYAAERPELFFKSMPHKVVGPDEPVGIRGDSRWNVPEPELALVLNSRGQVVGYTVGNDMSSRDIEGANLLYLPQAKIYDRSCALGPWIVLGVTEAEAREWSVELSVRRSGVEVFGGATEVSRIKRTFEELSRFLFRSQRFPHGAVLLTGTGVVPPDSFTLASGDEVQIRISGIGELRNTVVEV